MTALLSSANLLRAAEKVRLQRVRVTGSRRFRESDLVAALGLKPDMMVDISDLKNAADRLMQTGVLAGLQYKYVPLSTGIEVEYVATDGADFLPCRYDNIVWMSSDDLTKAVHDKLPLYDGSAPVSGQLLDDVSQAISQVLSAHGVATNVRYELHTPGVGQPVDAISFVSDTIKPKVQEITLAGAELLTPQEKLDNTKRLVGDDYNASNLRSSVVNGLTFLYGSKGYLRMRVGNPHPTLVGDPLQANVSVTVPVFEGEQYRWDSLTWTGNNAIPTASLEKMVSFSKADVVDVGKLDLQLEQVNRALKMKGFLAARIQRTATYDDEAGTVSYEVKVIEGDVFRMGNLRMTGLDPAVVDDLQKKWKLKPGDPYEYQYAKAFVKDNTARIVAHGGARTVKILEAPTPEKTVNVSLDF